MTFAEFEKLPDNGRRYELRQGELVEMPPPKHGHKLIEMKLLRLLEAPAGSAGVISIEVGFRIVEEETYYVADVIYVDRERWNQIPADGYMIDAPELVVEVVSPSNTAREMRDKRRSCLMHGAREFWIVDPKTKEVEVCTPDGRSMTYKPGQALPLFFAPGSTLAIDSIFEAHV